MNRKDWFSYPLRSIKGMHHSLPKIVLDLLSSWVKKRYKRQNLQMRNGLEMNMRYTIQEQEYTIVTWVCMPLFGIFKPRYIL
jgi:hypothetical protein